ncbi:MFS transporter [Halieaceae bacterium IMCC14734]|uniref:MFS transporter n=1 Tax=Candidatus Litorirhabdus singularis TaxID=2518993 RepID=A0ABT3TJ08_9GAMM|nr:MFS transporter [Candidatus Litorirhabdus singularis]MCX2981994.1 MFS transporter [Candidatus Litorirhabdus singularis]
MTDSSNGGYPRPRQAWSMLAALFLAYTLSFVDRQIITLLVGPIRADLGISDFQFSLLHGFAFALFFAVLGLPVGRLVDHRSRRHIVAWGIAIWSAMTALCGLATSFWQLFLARMGVGVGEATLSPAAYSMLSDAFPPQQLTRAVAVYSTGGTLGTGLALIIGGAVVQLVSAASSIDIPLLGTFKPWQASFLIVGIPGLLVAGLMLTVIEPNRQGVLRDTSDVPIELPVGKVVKYLWEHRASYGALFIVTSLMTALSSGFIMWYPTFLIRIHDFSMAEAGYSFGMLFLVFGTVGVLLGGWLATALMARGYADAHLRVIVLAASLALIPYLVGPLMPNAALALGFMAAAITATQMIAAVCVAAIATITPNQMRGQASAVFILAINFIGFGLGPSIIAFATDFIFADDMALPRSMSLAALLIAPASIVLYWRSLPHYRRHLAQSEAWR